MTSMPHALFVIMLILELEAFFCPKNTVAIT